jgi:ribonucleotide monophosphatase NagD (HAD superfamily)
VFVYHDPRDWALDTQLVMDLLLSHQGYIGTLSPLNNDATLPNRGFQQDGQPPLYFCNPDLWWAAGWHLPRLGQGGFRTALEGVWAATTGGPAAGVELRKTMFGKPHRNTYAFAERTLVAHRERMLGTAARIRGLTSVYMVGGRSLRALLSGTSGSRRFQILSTIVSVYFFAFIHSLFYIFSYDDPDNPESDIRGASTYASTDGSKWFSILVRTGVYSDGKPSFQPTTIVDDVWDAVRWGLEREGWRDKLGDVEAEAVA